MVIDKRNIQDFAAGGFRPHGEVELWAEGPVMRVIAQGPFNREAVLALMTQIGTAQTAIAMVVADDVEALDLMLPIVTKVYADQGRAVASFGSVAEAQAWLEKTARPLTADRRPPARKSDPARPPWPHTAPHRRVASTHPPARPRPPA